MTMNTLDLGLGDHHGVEDTDLIGYLTSKGVEVHRASGLEVQAHCLFCPDGDVKGRGKLYLNTESWLWDCKRCEARGNRTVLLEFFGDVDGLKFAEGADPAQRRRILLDATNLAHDMLLGNEALCQYLFDRAISEDQILSTRLGYVPQNIGLSDMLPGRERYTFKDLITVGLVSVGGREFFNNSLTIPYWSHGSVVQLREKKVDGKYRTMGGDTSRVFNSDALFGANEVLITEGEYDGLAVRSALTNCGDRRMEALAVISIAGAGSWPEDLLDSLSGAAKVFIGFDPDETGMRFAAKLKAEIGNRARVVELPTGLPKTDWSDLLSAATKTNPNGGRGWTQVRDLLIEADLAGKRMFSIRDAATKWRRMLDESPGLKLGWPSVDAILRPGLKPGQVMIPLAATGAGKSVFLSNIAHNVRARGVLYLSLELTASEVYEHLRRIHLFWFPQASREEMLAAYEHVYIVEQNRIKPGDLNGYVAEYEEVVGRRPGLVIVDYLQYFARSFRGSSAYDRSTDAVMELKAVAKEESVPIISPSQVNRSAESGKPLGLNHARDAGTVEETGDFVLSLYRPELIADKIDPNSPAIAPTGNFNAQLLKSRHGGVGRVFNLRFSPMSLVIVDHLDRLNAERVRQEVAIANQGIHYDDYRARLDQTTLPGVG